MNFAVLTGDLIDSQQLGDSLLKAHLEWLQQLTENFRIHYPGSTVGKLDIFRGDSWQFCLRQPALAVHAAIWLRAGLKAHPSRKNVDTRIGIGVGSIESLDEERISRSSGPAFLASGRALDELPPASRLDLRSEHELEAFHLIRTLFIPFLDLHILEWSSSESAAVLGSLQGLTQAGTAQMDFARKADGSSPSQQAIQDALQRIHWDRIQPLLRSATERMLKATG